MTVPSSNNGDINHDIYRSIAAYISRIFHQTSTKISPEEKNWSLFGVDLPSGSHKNNLALKFPLQRSGQYSSGKGEMDIAERI
ncbi:hypothetical protein JTE90_010459 [Oedothorax gibbosus]|uniref:Uncharacterized protein n=1 Tax=Oedothorax gibbosus TaxID=931172 RepID=A0AAV6W428_9ARAC|nr:hypothetical protein JTE90_010459 [Oedothorax gibbosus]